jgi:predicted phage-related endonuclease
MNINLETLIKERNKYKSIADAAAKEQRALETAIKAALKELPGLEYFGNEYHAKLSVFDSVRIDTKALKIDFPEIYTEYGKISLTEKLTIN